MSCINLSPPSPPTIPPIFLPSGSFAVTITFGEVGVTCCTVKTPAWTPVIPIPIPPAILIPIITAINAAIAAAFPILDQIDIPNCSLNGETL